MQATEEHNETRSQPAVDPAEHFRAFVRAATGGEAGVTPYRYQTSLAVDGFPVVLRAPTGAGKTMAVVLGWLYRRRFYPDQDVRRATRRRLVIALPMRVLVEQTEAVVRGWISNLEEAAGTAFHLTNQDTVGVHVVMGGAASREWVTRPEQDTVIIGTVDMLLSAALNRGYGLSQWVWPIYFGLLNNDTFWVFDEIEMTPDATATSRQLQAFRDSFGTLLPTQSMWMSATPDPSTLDVVDFEFSEKQIMTVSSDDLRIDDGDPKTDFPGSAGPEGRYCPSLSATKTFSQLRLPEEQTETGKEERSALLAETALDEHRKSLDSGGNPSTTIVICNTVQRAQEVAAKLRERISSEQGAAPSKGPSSDTSDDSATPGSSTTGPEIILLHSRFRFWDRQRIVRDLLSPVENAGGRIVVATQVIEAGVDITSKTLITELAPLPSIVQRAGRCNRNGETSGARVLWFRPEDPLPYSKIDLDVAEEFLVTLKDGGGCGITAKTLSDQVYSLYEAAWRTNKKPEGSVLGAPGMATDMRNLPENKVPDPISENVEHSEIVRKIVPQTLSVIRDKDLRDFFDTFPNLSGTHSDVSRFIRSDLDLDVEIVWRDASQMPDGTNDVPYPSRDERCPVPFWAAREWIEEGMKKGRLVAWRPDPLKRWARSETRGAGGGNGKAADGRGGDASSRTPEAQADTRWVSCLPSEIYPGLILIVESKCGGYDPEQGFVGAGKKSKSSKKPPRSASGRAEAESDSGSGGEQVADPDIVEFVECEDIAVGDDPGSSTAAVSLEQHLDDTRTEALRLAKALELPESWAKAFVWSAALHDVGKASPVFQDAVRQMLQSSEKLPSGPLAKSGMRGRLVYKRRFTMKKPDGSDVVREVMAKYFRHELVSALWLLDPQMRDFLRERYAEPWTSTNSALGVGEGSLPEETWLNLVTYLVAAHHGRVRLGLRSLPGEGDERERLLAAMSAASVGSAGTEERGVGVEAASGGPLYALGVLEGEAVRLECPLKFDRGVYTVPASEFTVDLSVMGLGFEGGKSTWRSRMVPLCEDERIGPFRLGFAEALVRVADWIASRRVGEGVNNVR